MATDRINDLKTASTDGAYDRKKAPDGSWSANAGDYVINQTKHLNNYQIAQLIAQITGTLPEDYTAAYVHLNKGMERMNLNNKLRYTITAIETRLGLDINKLVIKADKGDEEAFKQLVIKRRQLEELPSKEDILSHAIGALNFITAEKFYGEHIDEE